MEYQLEHQEITTQKHPLRLKLLVDNLQSPANFGMMTRMAEALGVEEIIFLSDEFSELTSKMKRSSRSAEKNLKVRFAQDLISEIQVLKKEDFEIIGLEYTSESKDITKLEFTQKSKALICGNEAYGISPELIRESDYCVHLPMYGKNTSMNVVMATSIALWELIH